MPCVHTPRTALAPINILVVFDIFDTLSRILLLTYAYLLTWMEDCIESFLSCPETKIGRMSTRYRASNSWPSATDNVPWPCARILLHWHQSWHWLLHIVPEVLMSDSWSPRQETAMEKALLRSPTVSGSGWVEFSRLAVVFPSQSFDSLHVRTIFPALLWTVSHENHL